VTNPKTLTPLSNLGLSHASEMLGVAFWSQSSQYLCISWKQKSNGKFQISDIILKEKSTSNI